VLNALTGFSSRSGGGVKVRLRMAFTLGGLINRYVGISPRFENPLEGGPTSFKSSTHTNYLLTLINIDIICWHDYNVSLMRIVLYPIQNIANEHIIVQVQGVYTFKKLFPTDVPSLFEALFSIKLCCFLCSLAIKPCNTSIFDV